MKNFITALYESRFVKSFRKLQKATYNNAREHGFQELETNELYVPTKLALVASEVSEALEAHRKGDNAEIGHELADIVIRVMDLSESLGVDLAKEIVQKHTFNCTREYKHGNKKY